MFTIDDVMKAIEGIDLSKSNPYPGCVYTAPNGEHCIAGQICVELGIEVPEWDDEVGNDSFGFNDRNPNTETFIASPMSKNFTDDAARFISDCQSFADNFDNNDPQWADCVIHAEERIGVADV
jgi:hypothetical protein